MMSELAARLEAFLFSEGGSLTRAKLTKLSGTNDAALDEALSELANSLDGSGLALVRTPTEVALAVSQRDTPTVQAAFERELGAEMGDAGLEVLAIVLYRGPSTRAEIDYIRGVNTSSTLRNLLSRGLLERIGNPEDAREYLYRPTVELLAHLGARELRELPEYERISAELASFESARPESDDHGA